MNRAIIIAVATLLVFAVPELAHGQAPRDGTICAEEECVRSLVGSLSWESVVEECNWFWSVRVEGEAAEGIVKIGRSATDRLIAALRDPERAVAAHLVLCTLWSGDALAPCSGFIDDVHGVPFQYRFGEMRFTSNSRKDKALNPEMLAAVQQSWINFLQMRAARRTAG